MKPRFITLEGIDGSGKSTHLGFIKLWLAQQNIDSVFTREPGGTLIGESLRNILLNPQTKVSLDTETLLMFAGRMEHIVQVIKPALFAGKWVISDRFSDASFAYQGGGRGLSFDRIRILENWVQQGLSPDLTLLFDAPLNLALQRTKGRDSLDRFEQEKNDFHLRVREAYLFLAKNNPQRFAVISTDCSIAESEQNIARQLSRLL